MKQGRQTTPPPKKGGLTTPKPHKGGYQPSNPEKGAKPQKVGFTGSIKLVVGILKRPCLIQCLLNTDSLMLLQ